MGVLEKFAEHFILQWPEFSLWLTLVVLTILFLVTPMLIFIVFKEKYNKGRYIFEKKSQSILGNDSNEMLYMLDTMKGKLYSVIGNARFRRMHEYDWKESRKKDVTSK
jgi:hypothetical protein